MRYFIIDGFNVVHKIPALAHSQEPHIALINYIKHKKLSGSNRNKVMIVFDGSINNDAAKEREFAIRFSLERSADDLIKAQVQTAAHKAQVVVVSDDREIRDFSKLSGAGIMSVAEFAHTSKPLDQTAGARSQAGKRVSRPQLSENKEISYTTQREITEELKKIWLKE